MNANVCLFLTSEIFHPHQSNVTEIAVCYQFKLFDNKVIKYLINSGIKKRLGDSSSSLLISMKSSLGTYPPLLVNCKICNHCTCKREGA